jgi:peptidoglycan/LPS O-acetylase OafA/YrhL
VASAAAVGIEPVRETLLWHLSYLTNFYIVINGWPLVVSHLWSLAVEQQFYMIWPFVIFFLPRALLPSALILLIASSLAFRIVWRDMVGGVGADVLAPASFDALGMGALVAVWRDKQQRLIDLAAAVGLGVVLVSLVIVRVGSDVASTAVTWIFGWVISRAAVGFDGITGKVLNNAALRYIGTISYGIYVMHEVVPFFLIKGGLPVEPFGAAFRSIALGLTFLLAALSWHFMERPIMRVGRAGL